MNTTFLPIVVEVFPSKAQMSPRSDTRGNIRGTPKSVGVFLVPPFQSNPSCSGSDISCGTVAKKGSIMDLLKLNKVDEISKTCPRLQYTGFTLIRDIYVINLH